MSHTRATFAVVMVLALGMTTCGKKTPSEMASDAGTSAGQAAHDAAKATSVAVEDAALATGDALGDAMKAAGEYLTQSKDTAVAAAEETLNGIEKKWQDLSAKTAPTTDEAKANLQMSKDHMAQTLTDAKAKLVEAKCAGADTWRQDVKPALDAALQRAKILYEDISAMFSNN
jgi:hypothetical protein